MFDSIALGKLREFTTGVDVIAGHQSIGSDSGLIQHVNKYFSQYDLSTLAIELDDLATNFGVAWIVLQWTFADNDGKGTLLKLNYTGVSAYGYVILVRSFIRDNGVLLANHDYLVLPEQLQGGGISRAYNKLLYRTYESLSIRKIRVHAGLEAGGYVWARVGFSAIHRYEVEEVLARAMQRIKAGTTLILTEDLIDRLYRMVEHFYNSTISSQRYFPIYIWAQDDEYGKDLLLGTDWQGEINFDDSTPVDIFVKYLNKK